ncbi:MAG TPA: bifunctional diaminohydroxyphosphoribosylaminopyrimidine deaminase/5-amino-6-(5-phosphoribosylamino)uracil reductase RibD [Candidatus Sulfotelmatobacter sp.]|jgi:diaminohydroxyphosphoribosylaminopyrimidine deaminase/5-amino-6-(5-phosphoribosylamino)uracil reductase
MTDHLADEQFLKHALELAEKGVGLASPNPNVGAVIVDSGGKIAGTGTYTYDGVKHAEVLALEQAGSKARGGTLYINLEPHAHQGRTPPCTDALIAAGIRRVVTCMADPNPKVSGLGFEKLRAAAVQVEVGRFENEARHLNETFARYIRHGVPLVTLKSAMTLDGKIAPPPNLALPKKRGTPAGGWLTGEAARAHVQELRHQSDAILVGIGTILADDPVLTDRSGKIRRRPLLRVVLDSHLRLTLGSRLVQTARRENARESDVLVFCSSAEEDKKRALEDAGIRVERISDSSLNSGLDLQTVLQRMGQLEITSLLIEGGSTVNGAALAASVVDKLFLYYAPKIMALVGAVPFACGSALDNRDEVLRLKQVQLHRFGEDVAIEGYLRDPYLD